MAKPLEEIDSPISQANGCAQTHVGDTRLAIYRGGIGCSPKIPRQRGVGLHKSAATTRWCPRNTPPMV